MTTFDDGEARRKLFAQPLTADDFKPLSATVRAEIGARSHRGSSRPVNDDHYLVMKMGRTQETLLTSLSAADLPQEFTEYGYAMAVADGLGSHGSGAVASRIALSTIVRMMMQHGKWNLRIDPKSAGEIIDRALWLWDRADQAVISRSYDVPELSDMSTSLTSAFSAGDHLFIAHVGHSRAYLFRDGALIPLTRDHTTEQHLADTGKPISMERRGRDQHHILTDAIGARGDRPGSEVEHFRILHGDSVLLCTNGLTDMLGEDRIADVLGLRRRTEEQCQILIDLAIDLGGEDNVTVVLAQYEVPTS